MAASRLARPLAFSFEYIVPGPALSVDGPLRGGSAGVRGEPSPGSRSVDGSPLTELP